MRTVFKNHAEVCHIWAQQKQNEGRASRIFFEGASIFSYGRHFEMARFVRPNVVFITTRTYSKSTAKHLSYTRRAVSHLRSFQVPSMTDHETNVKHYLALIALGEKKIKNSRRMTAYIAGDIERHAKELHAYLKFFGGEMKHQTRFKNQARGEIKRALALNFTKLIAEREARAKVLDAGAHERRAKRNAQKLKETEEKLQAWKNGEGVRLFTFNSLPCALRVTGEKLDIIETSHGARVTTWDAMKLHALYKLGKPIHGYTIGAYTVQGITDGIVTIGCHKIAIAEVERVLAMLPELQNRESAEINAEV